MNQTQTLTTTLDDEITDMINEAHGAGYEDGINARACKQGLDIPMPASAYLAGFQQGRSDRRDGREMGFGS